MHGSSAIPMVRNSGLSSTFVITSECIIVDAALYASLQAMSNAILAYSSKPCGFFCCLLLTSCLIFLNVKVAPFHPNGPQSHTLNNNSMTMLEWHQKGLGFFWVSHLHQPHTHKETMEVPKFIWWGLTTISHEVPWRFFDLDMFYCFNVVTKRVRHSHKMGEAPWSHDELHPGLDIERPD
jgi:hypothetical protein